MYLNFLVTIPLKKLYLAGILILFGLSYFTTSQEFIETKIVPYGGGPEDRFGRGLILAGNYLYIGAYNRGSVYVYSHSNNNWQFKYTLHSPSPLSSAYFGVSMATLGDILFIGATGDTSNGLRTGVVYVYKITDGNLLLWQKLIPDGASRFARFGHSIAANSEYLVIGAPEDTGLNIESGTAYLYKLENGYYNFKTKIVAEDAQQKFLFGDAVALRENDVFIGAPQASVNGLYSGSLYRYIITNDTVQYFEKIIGSSVTSHCAFGNSISSDSNRLCVGAPGNIYSQNYAGGVYIYEISNDSSSEKFFVKPDTDSTIYFGYSIKLKGDSLLIGAIGDIWIGRSGRGYLFVREDTLWNEKHFFAASDMQTINFFGETSDMDSKYFIFGTPYRTGAVYVYEQKSVLVEDRIFNSNSFQLYQNHPNPFNPHTKIKFTVSVPEIVQIKIYDSLGREIELLLDEYKHAGTYELVFDASELSAGVYYYRMKSKSHSETKKMILLK